MPRSKEEKSAYMKSYYAANKDKWVRTSHSNEVRNAQRRDKYASDEAYRSATKSKVADYRKRKPHMKKAAALRANYGMAIEEFRRLVNEQGGACAICRKIPSEGRRAAGVLHVDHDHRTGKVRGLLCLNCNHALGKFKDDTGLLLNAINYLNIHGRTNATTHGS